VCDRESNAAVGNEIEQGGDAGGHPLGRAAGGVLTGEPRDHGVLGRELLSRSTQDPRRGLGRSFGG
jgi:hypothetical protein